MFTLSIFNDASIGAMALFFSLSSPSFFDEVRELMLLLDVLRVGLITALSKNGLNDEEGRTKVLVFIIFRIGYSLFKTSFKFPVFGLHIQEIPC